MVWPRDSTRSPASARARRVWASSGAVSRSTCSSPAENARSPARSPTTSSPTPSRSKVRVCVVSVPERRDGHPVDQRARRRGRRAPRGSRAARPPGPRRSGRRPRKRPRAGPGGRRIAARRRRPEHHPGGWYAVARQRRERGQGAGVEVARTQRVEQRQRQHEEGHHGDHGGVVHDRADHQASDVDEVGQRGADVQRGPDQGEHRGRQRRQRVIVHSLGGEGGEEVDAARSRRAPGHPHQRSTLAVAATSIRHHVCASGRSPHQRHQPDDVRRRRRRPPTTPQPTMTTRR